MVKDAAKVRIWPISNLFLWLFDFGLPGTDAHPLPAKQSGLFGWCLAR
jgi:hypothetical protein